MYTYQCLLRESNTRKRLWFQETGAIYVRKDSRSTKITASYEVCYCGCCNASGWLTFRFNSFCVCSKQSRLDRNSRVEFILFVFLPHQQWKLEQEWKRVYQYSKNIYQAHSLFSFHDINLRAQLLQTKTNYCKTTRDTENVIRQQIISIVFR